MGPSNPGKHGSAARGAIKRCGVGARSGRADSIALRDLRFSFSAKSGQGAALAAGSSRKTTGAISCGAGLRTWKRSGATTKKTAEPPWMDGAEWCMDRGFGWAARAALFMALLPKKVMTCFPIILQHEINGHGDLLQSFSQRGLAWIHRRSDRCEV